MSYLRRISTRRIFALCAAVLIAAGTVTAIALATGNDGPRPPRKPLAQAVRDALTAPAPPGVSARIEFKNRLIDAASLQGSNPILTGATGRLWASSDRVRLELQASPERGGGDVQVLLDGDRLSVYDSGSNTVYRAVLKGADRPEPAESPPSLARIEKTLARLGQSATVSGAIPSDVAGRPAYTVRVAPRNDGGLLGSVRLAWDSARGVPLRAAVYASGSGDPVLELEATDIAFAPVAASDLTVAIPSGAKTVDLDPGSKAGTKTGSGRTGAKTDSGKQGVTGVAAVGAKLGFPLTAPKTLVGLPRREVRLVDLDGTAGALVTYGKGLGGIAVLQSRAQPRPEKGGGPEGAGQTLPKISINGASGEELDTALGTVVRFRRAGVEYTVLGSVPPAAAEAAARDL
ncbi:hypothetical protein BH20ACT18_BH20ACT18_09300 [soil metagenome]